MNLTAHFTLEELTISQEAARRGIDNTPPHDVMGELQKTAELLELVRSILQKPVIVSSGFRCLALNTAIGGAANSAHLWGGAADFMAPGYGPPLLIARDLATYSDTLKFDQLIYEFGSWVHIGRAFAGETPRRQLLTIDARGTRGGLP